jgi:hypothetical protein
MFSQHQADSCYMQTEQLHIITTIKQALRKISSRELELVNALHLWEYSDTQSNRKFTRGLHVKLSYYPCGERLWRGEVDEPVPISFYYELSQNPDLPSLFKRINIDVAIFLMGKKHFNLNIRYVNHEKGTIEIASPFENDATIPVKVLDLCLDLEAGLFDVKRFVLAANAVIAHRIETKPDDKCMYHPYIRWRKPCPLVFNLTVLLPDFTAPQEDQTCHSITKWIN